MLDKVTMETFFPHVGEPFRIVVDETWELRTILGEVSPWGPEASKGRPRVPFSLVFYGPMDSFIPQQIYRVEHATLEPMELFLAPIGPDEKGMRYEAVFT